MTFSPGRNTVNASAVPEPSVADASACQVCGIELVWGGRGRRPKYCSKACSSKADRQRERERQGERDRRSKALTRAADASRREPPLPGDFPVSADTEELLALGGKLRQHDLVYLLQLERAVRNDDHALAEQALDDLRQAAERYFARHHELAERILTAHHESDRHPAEPEIPPRDETAPAVSAVTTVLRRAVDPAASRAVPPRGEAQTPVARPLPHQGDGVDGRVEPRGDSGTVAAGPEAEAVPSRAETQGLADHVQPRVETQGLADRSLSGAVRPRVETQAPVTEAVSSRGGAPNPSDEGAGRLRDLVDQHRAQQADALPSAEDEHAAVTVPQHPQLRGVPGSVELRIPLDPRVFGDGWALEGWSGHPDVYLVTGDTREPGWVERGLAGLGEGWVAVYEGYFIADAATDDVLLHPTPRDAAYTVHRAYLQNL
ncbi:hypothetical protein AB0K51_04705 [Kitasatospora sp. NPDC049285]|uniref:hypothetical protein n=1 Tax=Kitasatospora sp. NPDC049285 TaxID=3157096 RepID=UPI003422E50E